MHAQRIERIERTELLVKKGYIDEAYFQTKHTKAEFDSHMAIADLLYTTDESISRVDQYFVAKSNIIDLPSDQFYQINKLICKLSFHVKNTNIDIISGVLPIVQHHINCLVKKAKTSKLLEQSETSELLEQAEPSGTSAEPSGTSAEPSGTSAKPSGTSAKPSEICASNEEKSFDETTNNKINYLKKIKRQFCAAIIIVKQNITMSIADKHELFSEDFQKYINPDTIDYIIDVSKIIVDFIEKFN